MFVTKTDRKSVFNGCEAHILDRLYIMFLYISYSGFFKKFNFGSTSKGVILQFYRKRQFVVKMTETQYFLVVKPIF
jgi:hypothetical protein